MNPERLRTVIYLSLGIPAVLVLIGYLFYRFYAPEYLDAAAFETRTIDLQVRTRDARMLEGETVVSDGSAGHAVLVADRNLDRNWNAPSVSFRTGERLSYWLAAQQGFTTHRYDHRGTGSSAGAPHQSYDLDLLASDLMAVVRTIGNAPGDRLVVVAHGGGCITALIAIQDYGLDPDALHLISCGGDANLLEDWGAHLLYKMKYQGVAPELLEQARREWNEYVARGIIEENDAQDHRDLQAFRAALRFLDGADLEHFKEDATRLSFFGLVDAALGRGVQIHHYLGETDEDLPQATWQATATRAGRIANPNYALHLLPETDHFLKTRKEKSHAPVNLFAKLSPFVPISEAFFDAWHAGAVGD